MEVADIPEDLKARAEEGATTTQSLAREGISNAINVARLLVSSPEFRKLVNDILSIIRDVLRQSIASGDEEQRDIGTGVGTDQEKSVDQAIDETTGKIVSIVSGVSEDTTLTLYTLPEDCTLLPGFIDCHVHLTIPPDDYQMDHLRKSSAEKSLRALKW